MTLSPARLAAQIQASLRTARDGDPKLLARMLDAQRGRPDWTWQRALELFQRHDYQQPPLDAAEFEQLCQAADTYWADPWGSV